jgi:hypothetical protein
MLAHKIPIVSNALFTSAQSCGYLRVTLMFGPVEICRNLGVVGGLSNTSLVGLEDTPLVKLADTPPVSAGDQRPGQIRH